MATFYYNAAADTDWNNLNNWWDDSGFTVQSTVLPSVSDDVILFANVTVNTGLDPTVNNITFNDPNYNYLYISINITCSLITFNGTSYLSSSTITGNAIFNDGSYNGGTIAGNATFNGSSYNPGTVTGTATYNSNYSQGNFTYNIYFINGQPTTLNVYTGNGYWNGTYYIGAIATTLDSNGTGCWNNQCYENGDYLYLSCPPCTGFSVYNYVYYIDGAPTSLDSNGNGNWNSVYYVGGVATTLDTNGDGTWNGVQYLGGIAETTLYYNSAVDTDWNNLSNWWTNLACTNAASFLPRTIDSVIFISGATCLSNGGTVPSIKNLTLN